MTCTTADLKCNKNSPTDEELHIPLSLDPSCLAISLPLKIHLVTNLPLLLCSSQVPHLGASGCCAAAANQKTNGIQAKHLAWLPS